MVGLAVQRDAAIVEYKKKGCLMIATLVVLRFFRQMLCALRFLTQHLVNETSVSTSERISTNKL